MNNQDSAQAQVSGNKKLRIYEILKDRIVANDLRPQEYLNEKLIAKDLGVSKTPVREAIQKLEHERLITVIPNKGSFVANISIDRIRELFEIREILECSAARLVAALPDRGQFEATLRSHPSFTINDGVELRKQLLSGYQIHTRIVEATGNSYLTDFYRSLLSHIVQVRVYFIKRFGIERLHETVEEHRHLLEAIIKGNAEEAGAAMRDHLRRSLVNINQLMLRGNGGTQ